MMNGKMIPMDRVIENVYRDYGFDNVDYVALLPRRWFAPFCMLLEY